MQELSQFKFFKFGDVEVVAYKVITDEDQDGIHFIAKADSGTLEFTPSWELEDDRDEAWEKNTASLAEKIAVAAHSEAFGD